jgi:hypothetical protein
MSTHPTHHRQELTDEDCRLLEDLLGKPPVADDLLADYHKLEWAWVSGLAIGRLSSWKPGNVNLTKDEARAVWNMVQGDVFDPNQIDKVMAKIGEPK